MEDESVDDILQSMELAASETCQIPARTLKGLVEVTSFHLLKIFVKIRICKNPA